MLACRLIRLGEIYTTNIKEVKQVEREDDILKNLNKDEMSYFMGALSYIVKDAKKSGKKTISIKSIESAVETAHECLEKYGDIYGRKGIV